IYPGTHFARSLHAAEVLHYEVVRSNVVERADTATRSLPGPATPACARCDDCRCQQGALSRRTRTGSGADIDSRGVQPGGPVTGPFRAGRYLAIRRCFALTSVFASF